MLTGAVGGETKETGIAGCGIGREEDTGVEMATEGTEGKDGWEKAVRTPMCTFEAIKTDCLGLSINVSREKVSRTFEYFEETIV